MESTVISVCPRAQASPSDHRRCQCEFCKDPFSPRPQTKNPRACDKASCQKARQKANEREWREATQPYRPPLYFEQQRMRRFKQIVEIVDRLCKCLAVGMTMLSLPLPITSVREALVRFFRKLGLRRVNKLCVVAKTSKSQPVIP